MTAYPNIGAELDELETTAFHEAAHAITAASVGRAIDQASVIPSQVDDQITSLGHVRFWRMPNPQPVEVWLESLWVRAQIRIMLAGYLMEDLIDPDHHQGDHIGTDHWDLWRLLYAVDPESPVLAESVVREEREKTASLLCQPSTVGLVWELVERLVRDRHVQGTWIHENLFNSGCGAMHPTRPEVRCLWPPHPAGEHSNDTWKSPVASRGDPAAFESVTWDGFLEPRRGRPLPMSAYPSAYKRVVYLLHGGRTRDPSKRWRRVLEVAQGSP